MGSVERRRRHREELRSRILEAALEIVSQQGLTALSIRAIAERVEYSSATIYLHFASKEALVEEVAREGFRRFDAYMHAAIAALPPTPEPLEELRALGRGYIRFALENTAYFRVMYDLPAVARAACGAPAGHLPDPTLRARNWDRIVAAVQRLGSPRAAAEPEQAAIAAWCMLHGLVTLYLSGHLGSLAADPAEFEGLVSATMGLFRDAMIRPPLPSAS